MHMLTWKSTGFGGHHSMDKTTSTYKKIKADFIQSYNYPQMGKTDIYWVDIEIIEKFRNNSHN